MKISQILRWGALVAGVLALILIPFLLFGTQVELWTHEFIETAAQHTTVVALVFGGLLATDVIFPVPSSLVSTASGFLLGFLRGSLVSFLGMEISCALGFFLGAKYGRPVALRFVGADELRRLEELNKRIGDWSIIISRPVPVLAEASVLFAGISWMSFRRFLFLATLSNLAIALVYGLVGAMSATVDSFLIAFAAAILLPALGMFLLRPKNRPA